MEKAPKNLPDAPGVYIFRGPSRAILYIGKATSLKTRVASYFRGDLMGTRGPIIVGMAETAKSVDVMETDSVLEALILEAALIKKHQPPFNTKEKSDKSFNYVVITKEAYPRVLIVRGRELENQLSTFDFPLLAYFGPFPQGSVLREALKIVRKIFPFRDTCKIGQGKPCFNAQIGLCPGVCSGTISKTDYRKTITRIKLFFEGKKKTLVASIERDMNKAAKELRFEEAARLKRTLFALTHIQDIALLKADVLSSSALGKVRVEAYDVAHLSGTNTVGVMVVIEDGEPQKSDYRKFKIKQAKNDDNAALREVLERRLGHPEWPMPKLIVVDGGKAQVETAKKVLRESGAMIPVVGVVKDEHHRPKTIIGDTLKTTSYEKEILLANSEAHRFAVGYHRALRRKLL